MVKILVIPHTGERLPANARGIFRRVAQRLIKARRLPPRGARMIDPKGPSPGHTVLRRPPTLEPGVAPFRPEIASHVPPLGGIKGKTTGIMDLGGNRVIYQVSGEWPHPPPTPGAGSVLRSHVEMHTLARMREAGLKEATLYLNKSPCPGDYGCMRRIEQVMQPGERLTIFFPGPDGTTIGKLFTGPRL